MLKSSNTLTKRLLTWFKDAKRDLPWRNARHPYNVWISEIMLQQTQVITVIPYFERWMNTFPDVHQLARAPLEQILKHWEGLGYYRRARMIHQSAQILSRNGFPEHYEGWLALPGIGPYTAAAISSMVYGQRIVAVDGNVRRVVARVFALPNVSQALAQEKLNPLLPQQHPGDFNEAMMELGATICTPKNPRCSQCPIQPSCHAFLSQRVEAFPASKVRTRTPHYHKYAVVHLNKHGLWLHQRQEDLLHGLWGFVLEDTQPAGLALEQVKHAYTHFRLTVIPIVSPVRPRHGQPISLKSLDTLALSTLDYKILNLLKGQGIL